MRKLIKLVLLLVVLVIAGLIAAVVYIDVIARHGIEKGAGYALGVDTRLEGADVKIMAGEFDMDRLKVSNPSGYATPHFLTMQDGGVAVSLASLREDTVELPHLTLTGVDMNLEKKEGKSNYDVILANLKRFEAAPRDDAKKFVIKKVTIRDIKVHLDVLPIAGAGGATRLDVPIDEIILEDVGSGTTRGVLLSELAGTIIKALLLAVADKAGGLIPGDIAGELRGHLAQLDDISKIADIEKLGDLGGALDSITKDAGSLGEKTKEELDKTLGNLLGGDKDKN